MGLDTVELVLMVEKTFDLAIPDRDAERLRTVGDLYRYVVRKITIDEAATCLSSAVFYRFRRALIDTLGVCRGDIRPVSSLEAIVPREDRRSYWQRLGQALELDLPRLRRPPPLEIALLSTKLLLLALLPLVFVICSGAGQGAATWAVAGLIIDEILLAVLLHTVTERHAVEFAPDCRTIRDIVGILAPQECQRIGPEARRWSEYDVWETLRSLIVVHLGVRPDEVTEHAGWAELGAD